MTLYIKKVTYILFDVGNILSKNIYAYISDKRKVIILSHHDVSWILH